MNDGMGGQAGTLDKGLRRHAVNAAPASLPGLSWKSFPARGMQG